MKHVPSCMSRLVAAAVIFSCAAVSPAATPEEALREAQQLETDGAIQKAVDIYKEFLAQNPTHSQVREVEYRLARCYDNRGDVDQAIVHFKKAIEKKTCEILTRTRKEKQRDANLKTQREIIW